MMTSSCSVSIVTGTHTHTRHIISQSNSIHAAPVEQIISASEPNGVVRCKGVWSVDPLFEPVGGGVCVCSCAQVGPRYVPGSDH